MGDDGVKDGLPGLVLPYGRTTGEAAFQEWSETVATIFDLDTSRENLDTFQFGFSAWHFGSLILGRSESDNIKFRRTQATIGRSSIDHYLVQVYETGGLSSTAEGKTVHVAPGDVWILDLARTVDIAETSFRSTNLAIPRNLLAPMLKDPDALHSLRLSGTSPVGSLLSGYLVDLAAQAKRMTQMEALSVAQSTVHLIAGCVGPTMAADDLIREGAADATLAAVRTFVDAELADPGLSVDIICKQFGLSRAGLYRLFEPFGGVQAHIKRRRLARCFHEIVTPGPGGNRISQIAQKWGFLDEKAFNRGFRDAYGHSPSDMRRMSQDHFALLTKTRSHGTSSDSQLGHWIKDLMRL